VFFRFPEWGCRVSIRQVSNPPTTQRFTSLRYQSSKIAHPFAGRFVTSYRATGPSNTSEEVAVVVLSQNQLVYRCKELAYILDKKIGLLERSEVATSWHLGVLHNVISLVDPAQWTGKYFLGKIRVCHRSFQMREWRGFLSR
jgi:hypothetical protein